MTRKRVQRSLRLPADLIQKIEAEGRLNERDFTKQVTYMLRKAFEKREACKEKVSA